MRQFACLALAALALVACSQKAAPVPASATGQASAEPPKLNLTPNRKDLLFSYVDAQGRMHDATSAEEVPAANRKYVLVRDLSLSPEELQVDRYVYVADLTREEDGRYPYVALSRTATDRALREGQLGPELASDGGAPDVVVYGTSWCPACNQARAWFAQRGLPFADRDIEKDPRAEAELKAKLARAGMPFGGVPVLEVKGQLLLGFDQRRVLQLLQASGRGP